MNAAADTEIPRKVPAGQGLRWLAEGFRLYRKNPLLLSAGFGLSFGLVMVLLIIPGVGSALSDLVWPVVVGGFMLAYRALDEDRELELPQLGHALKAALLPLMALGAVQLLGMLVIGKIVLAMGFDAQAVSELARTETDPAVLQKTLNDALPAILTGFALLIPLLMATWFAPALILFGHARPVTALGVSLRAVLRNWAAVLVNSFALGALLLLAALIPMMLGLLFAMPVFLATLYAAYQAIFAVWSDEPARPVQPDDSLA